MHAYRRALLAVLAVVLLCSSSAWSQLPGVRLPKVKIEGAGVPEIALPSVADLMREEPPLTTTLGDGLPRLPVLDGWEPSDLTEPWVPVNSPEGGFSLERGTYELQLDSFCLHAGSHGPSRQTEGYLHGPFHGAQAGLLQTVIRRYASTPDATRQEAQALLWAVLARTDLAKATGTARAGADKLLTPQEIAGLSGGPWGSLPDQVKREIRKQLGPAQRAIFDAQDKLRGLVTKPTAGFAQLERAAVRSGSPSRSEDDVALPDACWNLHPGGALVRYLPHGYSNMTVQVHVPSPVGLQRDAAGRVQRIWDAWGGVMEVTYAGGDGGLLRQVRFTDGELQYMLESSAAVGTAPVAAEVERWRAMEQLLAGATDADAAADARDTARLAAGVRALVATSDAPVPDWAADILEAVQDGALADAVAAMGRPVVDPPPPPGAPGAQGGNQPDGGGRPDGSGGSQGTPDGGGTDQPGGEQGGSQPDGSGRPDGSGGSQGAPDDGGSGLPGGQQGGNQPDGGGTPDGGSGEQPGGNEGGAQPGGESGGQPDGGGTPGGTRNRGGSRRGGKADRGGSGTTTVHFDPTDGMALPGSTGRQRLGISARPSGDGSGDGGNSDTPRKKRGHPRRNRPQPDSGGTSTPGGDTGSQPNEGGAPEGNNQPGGNDGGNQPGPDTGGNQPNGGGTPEGNTNPGGSSTPGGDGGGNPGGGGHPGRTVALPDLAGREASPPGWGLWPRAVPNAVRRSQRCRSQPFSGRS